MAEVDLYEVRAGVDSVTSEGRVYSTRKCPVCKERRWWRRGLANVKTQTCECRR
jgi:hypothetical protein